MHFTKYGRKEILLLALPLFITGAFIGPWSRSYGEWVFIPWSLYAAVFLWVLWFFRDPERDTPAEEGLFISPADGVVADITPLGVESALGREGVQVGVFMNVFNVHVNRAPCKGTVVSVKHKPGAYLDVRKPESYERNESVTVHMTYQHEGVEYPVLVRQIAGLVARRIVTDIEEGRELKRGERFGMIKFGSRLEVLLPKELAGEIRVSLGQKAYAGETILAAIGTSND